MGLDTKIDRLTDRQSQREFYFKAITRLATFLHADILRGLFTLKKQAIYSFETSIKFQLTTRSYIPEDNTLHNHRCENLKSYILITLFFLRMVPK
jgi:hypothetical protein